MRIKQSDCLYWAIFVFFAGLTYIALFAKLGSVDVNFTDEATHAVNAYEMIQNKNLWINTLRYETDYYNTKPPLMLWLIILGYKIFGYTPLGLRFFSALSGLAIYIITYMCIYKVRGKNTALIFSAFFPACNILFDFHMFRAGDMDSVYTLFFLLAIISLYRSYNKINYLLLYGVLLGLAFMIKATHFTTIVVVGVLFAPFLLKKNSIKKICSYYVVSYILGILIVLPWAIIRYKFDGFKFFADILFDETLGRTQKYGVLTSIKEYLSYIIQLIKEPICFISIVLILIGIVSYIWIFKFQKKHFSISMDAMNHVTLYFYLLSVWFVVVIGVYTIARGNFEWYIYSAYIPLIALGAEALNFLAKQLNEHRKSLGYALMFILMLISVCFTVQRIRRLPWNGSGGSPRIGFYDTVLSEGQESGDSFSKRNMYIENSYNGAFSRQRWEHDYMFYAMSTLDVLCVDGGVEAFLNTTDQDALLILDKALWEEYASVLTGHVILEDSGYLIFSKEKYGE